MNSVVIAWVPRAKSNRYKLNTNLQAVTTMNSLVACGLIYVYYMIGHCTNIHSFQIQVVNVGLVCFKTGVCFLVDVREDGKRNSCLLCQKEGSMVFSSLVRRENP